MLTNDASVWILSNKTILLLSDTGVSESDGSWKVPLVRGIVAASYTGASSRGICEGVSIMGNLMGI